MSLTIVSVLRKVLLHPKCSAKSWVKYKTQYSQQESITNKPTNKNPTDSISKQMDGKVTEKQRQCYSQENCTQIM